MLTFQTISNKLEISTFLKILRKKNYLVFKCTHCSENIFNHYVV